MPIFPFSTALFSPRGSDCFSPERYAYQLNPYSFRPIRAGQIYRWGPSFVAAIILVDVSPFPSCSAYRFFWGKC